MQVTKRKVLRHPLPTASVSILPTEFQICRTVIMAIGNKLECVRTKARLLWLSPERVGGGNELSNVRMFWASTHPTGRPFNITPCFIANFYLVFLHLTGDNSIKKFKKFTGTTPKSWYVVELTDHLCNTERANCQFLPIIPLSSVVRRWSSVFRVEIRHIYFGS